MSRGKKDREEITNTEEVKETEVSDEMEKAEDSEKAEDDKKPEETKETDDKPVSLYVQEPFIVLRCIGSAERNGSSAR